MTHDCETTPPADEGRLEAPVRPLAPTAWANGDELDNMLDDRTATVAAARDGWRGRPLYELSHDDIAAVNKFRAQTEHARQRDLKACRCDHNEYCRHCWPLDFRAGGLWDGHGA